MMATVPHVTFGLGLRKFQADGFLLTSLVCRLPISLRVKNKKPRSMGVISEFLQGTASGETVILLFLYRFSLPSSFQEGWVLPSAL